MKLKIFFCNRSSDGQNYCRNQWDADEFIYLHYHNFSPEYLT